MENYLTTIPASRREDDQHSRLERDNLDLKMKLYYLEEGLKSLTGKENIEEAKLTASTLRTQLEQREEELEERHTLLLKAKGAIESLRSELDRLRLSKDDLLSQPREELKRISELETQLEACRQIVGVKEQQRASIEDQMNQMEVEYTQMAQDASDARVEVNRQREQAQELSTRISNLRDDLTQARAYVDLYSKQLGESNAEADRLRKQAVEMQGEQDSYLSKLKREHAEEISRLESAHSEELDSLRASLSSELDEARTSSQASLESLRRRAQEEMSGSEERLRERLDQVQAKLLSEQASNESLSHQISSLRTESGEKDQRLDAFGLRLSQLEEEAQRVSGLVAKNSTLEKECLELRSQLSEREEKMDQLYSALSSSKGAVEEQDRALTAAEADLKRLRQENEGLRVVVAEGGQDRQRLKIMVDGLNKDLREARGRVSVLEIELDSSRDQLSRQGSAYSSQSEESKYLQNQIIEIRSSLDREKGKSQALEAALSEQRALLSTMREDTDREIEKRLQSERQTEEAVTQLQVVRQELGRCCSMMLDAMGVWDRALIDILDGNLFSSLPPALTLEQGSSAPNTPSRRDEGRGGVDGGRRYPMDSPRSSFDASDNSLPSLSGDQLLQQVATRMQRVTGHVERLTKVRMLFDTQGSRLGEIVLSQVRAAQERFELFGHRLADAQGRVDSVQAIVDRDRKQRRDESQDLTQFRETFLMQTQQKVSEMEIRINELARTCESLQSSLQIEKSRAEGLDQELSEERHLRSRLESELMSFSQTQSLVHSLSSRADEIAETNRMLVRECEEKASALADQHRQVLNYQSERDRAMNSMEELRSQIHTREREETRLRDAVESLNREIQVLRERQISPHLAQSIFETQSILSGGRPTVLSLTPHTPSPLSSSSLSVLVDSLSDITRQVEGLVRRTEEQLQALLKANPSANLLSSSGRLSSSSSSNSTSSLQILSQLLEENRRLTALVRQLASDMRKQINSLASSTHSTSPLNSNLNVLPPSPTQYNPSLYIPSNPSAHQSSSFPSQPSSTSFPFYPSTPSAQTFPNSSSFPTSSSSAPPPSSSPHYPHQPQPPAPPPPPLPSVSHSLPFSLPTSLPSQPSTSLPLLSHPPTSSSSFPYIPSNSSSSFSSLPPSLSYPTRTSSPPLLPSYSPSPPTPNHSLPPSSSSTFSSSSSPSLSSSPSSFSFPLHPQSHEREKERERERERGVERDRGVAFRSPLVEGLGQERGGGGGVGGGGDREGRTRSEVSGFGMGIGAGGGLGGGVGMGREMRVDDLYSTPLRGKDQRVERNDERKATLSSSPHSLSFPSSIPLSSAPPSLLGHTTASSSSASSTSSAPSSASSSSSPSLQLLSRLGLDLNQLQKRLDNHSSSSHSLISGSH